MPIPLSMMRTTAYPTVAAALMIARGEVPFRGVAAMVRIGLWKVGGWTELCTLVQQTPVPDAMNMHKPVGDPVYPFWGIILCGIYGGTFYWGIDQVNIQRVLGAKNLDQARWGAMFAILLKLTPAFIFALPGVIALVLYPGHDYKGRTATTVGEEKRSNPFAGLGVRG